MIRILHVVPNMQAGGLETLIMNLYRNIDRRKFQFDFLVHYKKECFYDKEIECLGGKIYRFSLREDNNIFKYKKELDNFFKQHKEYKIIHCHMASIGNMVFNVAKKNGVKIRIAHSHNSDTENTLKGLIKGMLIKTFKYTSTYNLACSKKAGEFLFRNKKFEILPNGIDLEKFKFNIQKRNEIREKLNLKEKFVLGHIGRFCKQKNYDFLLDVFYEVQKVNENSELLLVGTGELEEKIKEKVKKLGISSKVLFLGNRDDVNELYSAMDLFIFPSKFEGLGIVLIEAQASGLLTICSEQIPNEVMVSDRIKKIKLEKELWKKEILKNQNKKRYLLEDYNKINDFDIKKVSKRLEEIYESQL